jgi:uncharacterized membrane protein
MRNKLFVLIFALLASWGPAHYALAQTEPFPTEIIEPEASPLEEYFIAEVKEILSDESRPSGRTHIRSQTVKLKILNGKKAGEEIEVAKTGLATESSNTWYQPDTKVMMAQVSTSAGTDYELVDQYRLTGIYWALGLFALAAFLIGGKKSLGALVGLVFSFSLLIQLVLPALAEGKNPVLVSFLGAGSIGLVSIYLAHGISKRTNLAAVSTAIVLLLSLGLGWTGALLLKLFGSGSEEAQILNFASLNAVNLKGLLLAGMVIGALGVLDDITTSQTAAVEQLKLANPSFNKSQLFFRAMQIGKEHIAALINTLFLAYAGASLPLLLLFNWNLTQPWWVILNSEFVAEEIARALVGSLALIFAVPLTSMLAAYFFGKEK